MNYNIGIDIGGTTIKSGIVNDMGEILFQNVIPTEVDTGFEKIAKRLTSSIKSFVKDSGIDEKNIRSIGIGIPGIADKNGLVINATNLYWKNVPLSDRVREVFPEIKVIVQNDATIAAIAEKKFGGLKGIRNGLILTLGTGIGSGIIINDMPYIGSHGIGSEIGHMIVGEKNFYDCSCGNNGCFETFCSAIAISNYMKKLLKDGEKSSCMDYVDNIEDVTTKLIFQEYEKKDALSIRVVDRFIDYFGKGVASIINVLDPEVILIGGGFSKSFRLIEEKLNDEVDRRILHKNCGRALIKPATLGNDAGIIGASILGEFYE